MNSLKYTSPPFSEFENRTIRRIKSQANCIGTANISLEIKWFEMRHSFWCVLILYLKFMSSQDCHIEINTNMLFLRFEVRKVTPAVGEFTIELEDEYPDISHLHCCYWSNLAPAMYFSKNPCAGAPSFFGPLRYWKTNVSGKLLIWYSRD